MMSTPYPTNTWGSLAFTSAVAASAFVVLSPLIGRDGAQGLFFPGVLAVLIAIAAEIFRRHTIRSLLTELAQAHSSARYDVMVNGVQVGTIARTDVISLKLDAMRDPRTYVAQFTDLASIAARDAAITLALVPILLFWLVVASSVVAPAEVRSTFAALGYLSADDLAKSAASVTQIALLAFIVVIGVRLSVGTTEGIFNAFRRSVHMKIRQRVACPSVGTLSLRPGNNGSAIFVDRTRKVSITTDRHAP